MDYIYYYINKLNEFKRNRIAFRKQVYSKPYIYIKYTFMPHWVGRYKKVKKKLTKR